MNIPSSNPCTHCNRQGTALVRNIWCSKRCKSREYSRWEREKELGNSLPEWATCPGCSEQYRPIHPTNNFCSPKCKTKQGIDWNVRSYSPEELTAAVKNNYSYTEVLRALNLRTVGANHVSIKKAITALSLDTSHFVRKQPTRKKSSSAPVARTPIEDYLQNKVVTNSHTLRERLIEEGIKEARCEACQRDRWYAHPIKLELHHIDGDSSNNRLSNLLVLCRCCHGVTLNFGKVKKSLGRGFRVRTPEEEIQWILTGVDPTGQGTAHKAKQNNICSEVDCDLIIHRDSTHCRSHASSRRHKRAGKISWPSTDELCQMVIESSFVAVGKKLGVSDNAVRKHLRSYGIDSSTLRKQKKKV